MGDVVYQPMILLDKQLIDIKIKVQFQEKIDKINKNK